MPLIDVETAMKNPRKVCGTPEALEESAQLTVEQKRAILRQWQDQLQQLLDAEGEGMTAAEGAEARPGANAEWLRRVTDALTRLDAPARAC